MPILHTRVQHPVGQGFFHSADFGKHEFSFVYDCGSWTRYSKQRSKAIQEYLKGRTTLDILFLSHAHGDHVTGVPELVKTITPKVVVLPLLEPEERLFAFMASARHDPAVASNDFFLNFTANPAQALGALGVRHIIFVRGDDDGGAPGSGGPVDGIPPVRPEGGEGPGWTFVGNIKGIKTEWEPSASGARIKIQTIPHTCAMQLGGLTSPSSQDDWQLATYVDPGIAAQRSVFLKLFMTGAAVRMEQLSDPVEMKALLSGNGLKALQKAYKHIVGKALNSAEDDLNYTSLCLYSGPRKPVTILDSRVMMNGLGWHGAWHRGKRCAWLSTADAELKDAARLDGLLKHYGKLRPRVATLTVPHHGSEANFNPRLLRRIMPNLCVLAAAPFKDWRHPAASVVQAIASHGMPLAVVTEGKRSLLAETFFADLVPGARAGARVRLLKSRP